MSASKQPPFPQPSPPWRQRDFREASIRLCRFRPWVVWWDPTPPSRFRWTSSLWRRWTKTATVNDIHEWPRKVGTLKGSFLWIKCFCFCVFFLEVAYFLFDVIYVPLLKGCWNDFAPSTGDMFIVSPIPYLQKHKEKVSWNLSQDLMRITLSWDGTRSGRLTSTFGGPGPLTPRGSKEDMCSKGNICQVFLWTGITKGNYRHTLIHEWKDMGQVTHDRMFSLSFFWKLSRAFSQMGDLINMYCPWWFSCFIGIYEDFWTNVSCDIIIWK